MAAPVITFTEAEALAWLASFLQPFFRLLGLFGSAPVLSSRQIPARVRVGLALILALTLAPLIPGQGISFAKPDIYLLLAGEALLGLIAGFTARLLLTAARIAGDLIGMQMGLGFAAQFDPQMGGQTGPVSQFLDMSLIACFVAVGGPDLLIAFVARSLHTLPLTELRANGALQMVELLTLTMHMALVIALPYMAMLLLLNLTMGVMARIAPQMSIFSIGFPLSLLAGLTLMVFGMEMLEAPFGQVLEQLFQIFETGG